MENGHIGIGALTFAFEFTIHIDTNNGDILFETKTGDPLLSIDGATGESSIVADDILGPNGLCFSPDERILYVVESRGVPHRRILAYDVAEDGRTIRNRRALIDACGRLRPLGACSTKFSA